MASAGGGQRLQQVPAPSTRIIPHPCRGALFSALLGPRLRGGPGPTVPTQTGIVHVCTSAPRAHGAQRCSRFTPWPAQGSCPSALSDPSQGAAGVAKWPSQGSWRRHSTPGAVAWPGAGQAASARLGPRAHAKAARPAALSDSRPGHRAVFAPQPLSPTSAPPGTAAATTCAVPGVATVPRHVSLGIGGDTVRVHGLAGPAATPHQRPANYRRHGRRRRGQRTRQWPPRGMRRRGV
mmetsp:Transcript_25539/g.74488  ORF Transcript_25539/g.74488 Transcript_25539/m.74488 type:complete len:236 (+) Transcript_25539:542-1249(+)